MRHVDVIIVAGGLGTRFKSKVPKPFVLLKGKPLITYSLKLFEKNSAVGGIIVVGSSGYLDRFKRLAKPFRKVKAVVVGGQTRTQSVKCGLAAVSAEAKYIFVHDAARPFVDDAMIKGLLTALTQYPAAIIAVPVKATIKQVNAATLVVEKTPDRATLWDVQTPQAFHRDVLIKAHAKPFKGNATDDAMLVERLGLKVKIVEGNYKNIKITTPEDLLIAKLQQF